MGHRRMETAVEKYFNFILSLSTGGEFLLPLLYILLNLCGLFIPCIMIETKFCFQAQLAVVHVSSVNNNELPNGFTG